MSHRAIALAAMTASTLGLAACGTKQFDPSKTETQLRNYLVSKGLSASQIQKLSCPSGVDSKVGASFNCKVNVAGGQRLNIQVTQIDKQVHLRLHTTQVKYAGSDCLGGVSCRRVEVRLGERCGELPAGLDRELDVDPA